MPTNADVYKPERSANDALFTPEVRALYPKGFNTGRTRTDKPVDAILSLDENQGENRFVRYTTLIQRCRPL